MSDTHAIIKWTEGHVTMHKASRERITELMENNFGLGWTINTIQKERLTLDEWNHDLTGAEGYIVVIIEDGRDVTEAVLDEALANHYARSHNNPYQGRQGILL